MQKKRPVGRIIFSTQAKLPLPSGRQAGVMATYLSGKAGGCRERAAAGLRGRWREYADRPRLKARNPSRDGADQWPWIIQVLLKFAAKTVDVNIERVVSNIGKIAPSGFDQMLPRRDQSTPAHQHLQQIKLFASEMNLPPVAGHSTAAAVEHQSGSLNGRSLAGLYSPRDAWTRASRISMRKGFTR